MQGRRLDRVGSLIQMELSKLLLMRMRDPRLGFVTVTHVDVAADLKTANVFYSVMGDEKAKKDTQIALEKAAGFLQKEIARTLILRFTPKLTFKLDRSLDEGMKIDKIIRDIQKEEGEASGSDR